MRIQSRKRVLLHLGGGDGRVVEQAQLVIVSGVKVEEEVFRGETDAHGQGAEEHLGVLVALPVEGCGESPEPGEDGFGEPDVGLVGVAFAADFVAFLGMVVGVCGGFFSPWVEGSP